MTQELMQRLGIQSPETAEKVEQFLLALEERNRLLTVVWRCSFSMPCFI